MVLQSIRDRLTGILAFFILGILVIPFAFVGVNSYFTSGAENAVARVNDVDIGFNEFNQSYSNYRRRMQSIMGAAFDPVQFDSLIARREHLERMIDEELIRQAATEMGLALDDDRLAERIRSIPAFQVDGVFNADVYQNRLQSQGLTPQQFEAEMRIQSVLNELPDTIVGSSIATRSELERYVSLLEQQRSFRAVVFPADPASVDAEFSEEEIEEWYDAHRQEFRSEERVVVDYLELNALDIDSGVEPDEEFLRTRFEQQEARFISPERRRASHILIEVDPTADEALKQTARQTAAELAEQAKSGADFAELARQHSDDLGSREEGGDLGWIEPGLMSELFEEALYELTPEQPISDPVQTGFGWHVIKLEEIDPASGMSYEEARPILIREHQEEEAEREYLDIADRLVDLIYEDPTTLEGAALDLGLEIQTTEPFSRAGGQGIAANPEVVDAAFSDLVLLQESVSDPVDLGDNHMVMLKLREHLPATVKPLSEVRDQVIERLRLERASEKAQAAAENLLAALEEDGASLESLAAERELDVVMAEGVNRRSVTPDATVVEAVFRLQAAPEDLPLRTVIEAEDGYAVVVLDDVTDGQLSEIDAGLRQQYQRQIANANANSEAYGLLEQLRANATIEVFEDRLQ